MRSSISGSYFGGPVLAFAFWVLLPLILVLGSGAIVQVAAIEGTASLRIVGSARDENGSWETFVQTIEILAEDSFVATTHQIQFYN